MSRSSPPSSARRPRNARPWLARDGEADRVLADGDHVSVRQLLVDDGFAVDQRAVGAAEVADPVGAAAQLDPAVMAGRRGVADDDVVVPRAPDGRALLLDANDATGERPR